MADVAYKKYTENRWVIDSEHVRIFPCVSRATEYQPDSMLTTEYNLTHIPSVGVKSSYVVDYVAGQNYKVVLNGYMFELLVTNERIEPVEGTRVTYFGIKIDKDKLLSDVSGTNKVLDISGFFYGLALCSTEPVLGEFDYTVSIEDKIAIKPISGTDDGTNWTSISIGDKTRAIPEQTVVSVNGKTGTVVLDATEIQYDSNKTIKAKIDDVYNLADDARSTAEDAQSAAAAAQEDATNAQIIASGKSTVTASTTTVSSANTAKSIKINNTNWNLPEGGGGTAGVSSLGGKTGAISVGTDLYMDDETTPPTLKTSRTISSIKLNGSTAVATNATIYAPTSVGTLGNVLVSGGTSKTPTWVASASPLDYYPAGEDTPAILGISINGNPPYDYPSAISTIYTPEKAGNLGQLLYSGSGNGPQWLGSGTAGQVLTSAGSNKIPTWKAVSYIPTSSGTSGQVLVSSGGTTPTWQTVALPTIERSTSYAVSASNGFATHSELGLSYEQEATYIFTIKVQVDTSATADTIFTLPITMTAYSSFGNLTGEIAASCSGAGVTSKVIHYFISGIPTTSKKEYRFYIYSIANGSTSSPTKVDGKITKIIRL